MSLTQEKAAQRKFPSRTLWIQLSYRLPMAVTESVEIGRSGYYPRCPRCRRTMDREYTAYCDRCGQKLSWIIWENARILSDANLQP